MGLGKGLGGHHWTLAPFSTWVQQRLEEATLLGNSTHGPDPSLRVGLGPQEGRKVDEAEESQGKSPLPSLAKIGDASNSQKMMGGWGEGSLCFLIASLAPEKQGNTAQA